MSRDHIPEAEPCFDPNGPTRDAQKKAASLAATLTGPHRPRLGPQTSGLLTGPGAAPRPGGRRRLLLFGGTALLLAVQAAAALWVVRTRQHHRAEPEAARLYREARELYAAVNRLSAGAEAQRRHDAASRRLDATPLADAAQLGGVAPAPASSRRDRPRPRGRARAAAASPRSAPASAPRAGPIAAVSSRSGRRPRGPAIALEPRPAASVEVQPREAERRPAEGKPAPPPASPAPTPAPAPARPSAAAQAPRREPASAAPPAAKPAPASVAVPYLKLPRRTIAKITEDDGRRSSQLAVVCKAVELVAGKAAGRSAAGTTSPFAEHLYAEHQGSKGKTVTLYPQVMGYLVAEALLRGRPGVGARLIQLQASGQLASMAAAGWRP